MKRSIYKKWILNITFYINPQGALVEGGKEKLLTKANSDNFLIVFIMFFFEEVSKANEQLVYKIVSKVNIAGRPKQLHKYVENQRKERMLD